MTEPKNVLFHLNMDTGNPDVCFGRNKCRLQDSEHYTSRDAAQAAYERHMYPYLHSILTKRDIPKSRPI